MEELDINSAFDEIFLSESKLAKGAFHEGHQKGIEDGLKEGYHLGYHRGVEIGQEVGFYKGVLSCLKESTGDMAPRVLVALQNFEVSIAAIPACNAEDCDIVSLTCSARNSFKLLMSLLKIPLTPPSINSAQF